MDIGDSTNKEEVVTAELFPELGEALRDVLNEYGEDTFFRGQLTSLVVNAYADNVDRSDVKSLLDEIELVDVE